MKKYNIYVDMSNVFPANFGNRSPEINLIPPATEPTNGFEANGTQPGDSLIPDIEGSKYQYLNNCARDDLNIAQALMLAAKRLSSNNSDQV